MQGRHRVGKSPKDLGLVLLSSRLRLRLSLVVPLLVEVWPLDTTPPHIRRLSAFSFDWLSRLAPQVPQLKGSWRLFQLPDALRSNQLLVVGGYHSLEACRVLLEVAGHGIVALHPATTLLGWGRV